MCDTKLYSTIAKNFLIIQRGAVNSAKERNAKLLLVKRRFL